jgi:mannose-6-phosphate isomerase-like protein (cupin superfamily)
VGQPQLGSLSKLADQQRNTKERREVMLSCSGNTRNMLLALTDEQPQRIYDTAESTFYVLSGQGAAIVGKIQSVITTGSFIAVPRGTPFVLARQGNRPLIMLWTLSGEPCEVAK